MWTAENTEDFTAAELTMINRVAERVFALGGEELEVYSVNDAITNEWLGGITEGELLTRVRKSLGI